MRACNLFRRKDAAGLCCAAPTIAPVPAFVTGDGWEYAQSLEIGTMRGFDMDAAQASAGANGFYLLHSAS